ncbi:MAG: SxtJ family membrane protein [PVC group bacterium]
MIDFDFTTEKKDIRLFSRIVPVVLLIWGTVFGFSHNFAGRSEWILYGIAVVLFFWGMISPYTLRPLYTGWMYFTRCVAWLLTTVVLGLVFYIGFTGIGLLMRLLGKNPLDRKFDRSPCSYWLKHRPYTFNKEHYERQF